MAQFEFVDDEGSGINHFHAPHVPQYEYVTRPNGSSTIVEILPGQKYLAQIVSPEDGDVLRTPTDRVLHVRYAIKPGYEGVTFTTRVMDWQNHDLGYGVDSENLEIDTERRTIQITLPGPGCFTLSLATLERDDLPYLEQRVSLRFV
jgi:hypothetical protein